MRKRELKQIEKMENRVNVLLQEQRFGIRIFRKSDPKMAMRFARLRDRTLKIKSRLKELKKKARADEMENALVQ